LRGIGRGNPHQIAVWVDESVLADDAATVTIKLETAADEGFAVPIAVETSRPGLRQGFRPKPHTPTFPSRLSRAGRQRWAKRVIKLVRSSTSLDA
jgi:hypothetical protein